MAAWPAKITSVCTKIEVIFFGDKTSGSLPPQNISKFSEKSDVVKENLKRKGYAKAVKEALIEMAISKPTKSRRLIKHASTNVTIEKNVHAPVHRSLPLPEEKKVISAELCANTICEEEMNVPVRRSPRLRKKSEAMPEPKDDKQHKRKTTVRVGARRSERLRQKYIL